MSVWLPGALVLLAGLVAGWLATRRLAGDSRRDREARDLELRVRDLEERRDDLLAVLREGTAGEETEREALESSAARTLMELEAAREDFEKLRPKKRQTGTRAAAAPGAPRHFLTGFAYGAGLFLLLGALLYWALRDARPREEESPAMAPVGEHPASGELPPQVAAQVAQLEARLASDPGDLAARRDLAYVLLSAGRFIEAFRQGEAIAEIEPENPDGLHVRAVVRLTMGQVQRAAELLSRALTADPNHLDSLYTSGILALQADDYPQAIAAWERARLASSQPSPQLERMLRMAREGRSPQEILGLPPEEAPPGAAAPAAEPSGPAFRVRIEAAPGLEAPAGAALFVTIREGETGPPTAARKIDRPSFPLEVMLTSEHSMMGRPLPESGILDVRLDADGSASTRGPDDVSTRTAATLGEMVRVVLSN